MSTTSAIPEYFQYLVELRGSLEASDQLMNRKIEGLGQIPQGHANAPVYQYLASEMAKSVANASKKAIDDWRNLNEVKDFLERHDVEENIKLEILAMIEQIT